MEEDAVIKKMNEGVDKKWLIENLGRRIGRDAFSTDTHWFVFDGKVFLHNGEKYSEFVDEYFSFCNSLREGKVTGFRRVNNFHMDNSGS